MDKLKLIEAIMGADQCSKIDASTAFEVGKAYFFRTVTHHQTGRVRNIVGKFLVLDDVAWIADDGRFSDALKTGKLNEVEPMPDGSMVNSDALIDAAPWNHPLPKEQK